MHFSKTRTRTRLTAAAALSVFLLALLVPASPANAAGPDDDTIGVATRPAGPDGRPDQRSRFSYESDPGQTISDQVFVGNTGSEPKDFTVYATDAYNAASGTFGLLETGKAPSDIGTWVKFENGQSSITVTLDPNEARLLPFTVEFPAEATPGDHIGGIVASVLEKGQQVSLDRRVATAIYARVSGTLQPRLAVSSIHAEQHGEWWNPFDGSVRLTYTVENPGNVALAANITAGVNTWFGIPAAHDLNSDMPVLLPGNSASYEVDLPGVGQWLFLYPYVQLSPFVDTEDLDGQLLPVPRVSRDTVTWAVPWTVLIGLLIVALVVALVMWRRRRENARAIEWMELTEARAREEALAGASEKASSRGA